MFDVFYSGPKPNLFAFEKSAATLEEAAANCRTTFFWYINGNNDYSNFNFDWRPLPYEADFTHVWPSQWQKNGSTYFAARHTKEFNWHWHEDSVVNRKISVPIYYMDFHNPESNSQFELLQNTWKNIKRVRYIGSHLEVFKRIISQATTDYIWITSSICNYELFDFTWHPSQWQAEMIHCFSWNESEYCKRGDTFYIHVDSFKQQMYDLELLDWFNVIHYNSEQIVNYFACPEVRYTGDNLIEAIKNYNFEFPYARFVRDDEDLSYLLHKEICIWSEKDRQVLPYTSDHSCCLVHKDIKQYIKTQVYDYPYLNNNNVVVKTSPKLDIVYISNGEPDADRWFNHCLEHSRGSNIQRIMNINGRTKAYQAAAEASRTDWFFAVFAKLEVNPNFDWNWQPDYWQEPKHYIFHAQNPVNGLVYGHQAMIAYNKKLVLETVDSGLDFTLTKAHEVVPILSGTAHYNQDPWTTWRTAFREVLKLKHFSVVSPSVETNFRLKKWLTVGNGLHGLWSIAGADDAIAYYESVNGEYDKLMLSFEWAWLKQYYDAKY